MRITSIRGGIRLEITAGEQNILGEKAGWPVLRRLVRQGFRRVGKKIPARVEAVCRPGRDGPVWTVTVPCRPKPLWPAVYRFPDLNALLDLALRRHQLAGTGDSRIELYADDSGTYRAVRYPIGPGSREETALWQAYACCVGRGPAAAARAAEWGTLLPAAGLWELTEREPPPLERLGPLP